MNNSLIFCASLLALAATISPAIGQITQEAATPTAQHGSTGVDQKSGSLYGRVLGKDWGTNTGDWAEYRISTTSNLPVAFLHLRYARQFPGSSHVRIAIDGVERGAVTLPSTGGWGDTTDQFQTVSISIGALSAGNHTLRVTVGLPSVSDPQLQPAVPVLDRVGNRTDKNTVGHGVNVALYTGTPSRFFYSTYDLGNVFSAVDGGTIRWFPDYVLIDPNNSGGNTNVNLDQFLIDNDPGPSLQSEKVTDGVTEQRQICVSRDDVVVSRVFLTNHSAKAVVHQVEVRGDCRQSADYRGQPGGEKVTRQDGDALLLIDHNAFPSVLHDGLVMAIGASEHPTATDTDTPGAYRLTYTITVPENGTRVLTLACAFGRDTATAKTHLAGVLRESDPVAQNRRDWTDFYEHQVPQFTGSDQGLNELYGFRWFLLKFSLSGGDLG